MSVTAVLCGIAGDLFEVLGASPPDIRAHVADAAGRGYALVELDLPIGRLTLPRDLVDRAILARVTRGAFARPLLFVHGHRGGVVKVKPERALDFRIEAGPDVRAMHGDALVTAAVAILAERGALPGKELLREARARRGGGASTSDGADLAKAVVRAWNDGLIRIG